jgi:hypothetical protein
MKGFSKELLLEGIRAILGLAASILVLYIGYTYFNTNTPPAKEEPVTPRQGSWDTEETQSMPPLDVMLTCVVRSQGRGDFRQIRNGDILQSGDQYKIVLTPQFNGYVYIFQLDSSSHIQQLFPFDQHLNPVQAGQTYYAPAQNFSFELDTLRGTETIYVLASRTRDVALEQQYQAILAAKSQQPDSQEQAAHTRFLQSVRGRGMAAVIPDQRKTVHWQEHGQQFSTLQQRLEFCHACVMTLTFQHQ